MLALRHARSWTQEDLAERAGLSVRYLGKIERRQVSVTIEVLGRLARVFDLDPGALLRPIPNRREPRSKG
jgi:transcriptional regulator with XRE-family HTH domain